VVVVTRLVLGVQYLSDMVGAVALGAGSVVAVAWVLVAPGSPLAGRSRRAAPARHRWHRAGCQ